MGSSFYHHSQNSSNRVLSLPTYKEIINFKQNANTLLLYNSGPWVIGTDHLKTINLNAISDVTNYKGKNVKTKILSIPVVFSDNTVKLLTMESNPENESIEAVYKGG